MSMMDGLIRWSVRNRLFVIVAALALSIYGAFVAVRLPVDVFPDLTAPTVTIVTEAHGLAPEEVEVLVTMPIESSVNGATGVRRVRSASGIGISVVWVEFDWGTDVYVARQIVGEKLQLVGAQIPSDIGPPTLAPISSIMGEILFVAMKSERHTGPEVREAADWLVRKRLLSLRGVAQVIPIGGGVRQFQVVVDPTLLRQFDVTMANVVESLEQSNANSSGGFAIQGAQESLIRGVGRLNGPGDIERAVVAVRTVGSAQVPVTVAQIGRVVIGPGLQRGTGSAGGEPAVVIGILKQPGANTLELTRRIDSELDAIERTLPKGMKIERHIFRQADFIQAAVSNVAHALRDGAILVALILLMFLLDVRTTLISLAALPVSLVIAVLALRGMGATLNTMTLGGLTIAIGALVDDAVIDVENVFRRLRENLALPQRRAALDVIIDASREVRGSIVFATLIVMLVFLPLLFLSGVEGRLLVPLGIAYLVAIFASLVVALTLTPALCAWLLPNARSLLRGESVVVRGLKAAYRPFLRGSLRHPMSVILASIVLLGCALALVPGLGRTFLPPFNEGALTIGTVTLPGTSLQASDDLGRRVEQVLLTFPEVASTARRTGRAELDEHAQDVYASEVDVRLKKTSRDHEVFLAELRKALTLVPGVTITIGQPISHRIDHMLSGTRANIAVKLFGDDLAQMQRTAQAIRQSMSKVSGVVDLSVEQPPEIPQTVLAFDRDRLAKYGLRAGELAELVETAFAGRVATRMLQGQRTYDVVVRYGEEHRADRAAIGETLVDTPSGAKVPLKMLADIRADSGPNLITRENVQRKAVVMANVAGRDLGSVVADIRAAIARDVPLPQGWYVEYGGQFEAEAEASRTLGLLGAVVIAGIFLLLYLAFRKVSTALLVMVNLPLALVGGVVAVWLTGGVLSVASLVGFITLFGIATRNGIMMVSHFEHLMREEGASLDEAVERGSLERLSPILMTALCAGLALVPLVLAGGEPGNEIQAPMGVVLLGGLMSSTALNMLVVPALYRRFGKAEVHGSGA